MTNIYTISVVIPAYNEEKNLRSSIKKIHEYLYNLVENNFEIIIVENGSTDRTLEVAKRLAQEFPNITAFSLKKPSFGGAYRFGIQKSSNDMITLYPVDLAFSLDFIGRAFKLIQKFPVVLGVRFHSKSKLDRPLIRIIISKIHTILVNLFFQAKYNDVDCLKAFRSKIGKKLVTYTQAKGPFIEVEFVYLIKKFNIDYIEIPINHVEKEIARHPFYIIKSIFKNFIELFKFRIQNLII